MSLNIAESRVSSCRRDLERHRKRQADEESRAARLDSEAARYEAQAARPSSPSSAQSSRRSAERKREEARRARDAAAKASKAVADAQKKLHDAEAALARERAREARKAAERARRDQERKERESQAEERRQQTVERARERELEDLRVRTAGLEREIAAAPWAHAPATVDVLFIAASPEDQQPLRLDKEVREIQQRIRMTDYRDVVRFHYRLATQVTDLMQALNEVRRHIVHFSGHGTQGALIFEDADGFAKALDNADLAHLLRVSSERIRLAVFNSCDSAHQAQLACDHLDAAIGMGQPIQDEAAKVFAGQFYNSLGFGKSLRVAFEQAELQTRLAIGRVIGDPQLFTAPGVDASEIYLVKPPGQDEQAA